MIALAYQTIHDPKLNSSPVAGELLVRWLSNGQVIGPGAIEKHSSLNWGQIDEQVLTTILESPRIMAGQAPLFINVSDVTLSSSILLANFCLLLDGIVKGYSGIVVVEIPESSALSGRALDICLQQIAKAGAKVGIDDFGVAHADMHRLDEHHWDFCKISLPSLATTPTLDWLITLQHKCRDRKIQVVCEQIERSADLELIRIFPNAWVQGFAYSMPQLVSSYKSNMGVANA